MKEQSTLTEDITIKVDLKMSEANMIIEALSARKFQFEALIQSIVNQGNPQLPVASRAGKFEAPTEEEFPIGLSEEVDEAILALFSEEYFKDKDKFTFDSSKPGHFIVVATGIDKATAEGLIAKVDKFVNGLNLECIVNAQEVGTVAFVFSFKKEATSGSEVLHVSKEEVVDNASLTGEEYKGISPEFDKHVEEYFEKNNFKCTVDVIPSPGVLNLKFSRQLKRAEIQNISDDLTEGSGLKLTYSVSGGKTNAELK